MIIGKAACGLRYAIKKSGDAVGYCSLTIKCGSRDEEGFHNGIAHFTEHTIFKGTSKKSAKTINSCLSRLGGDLNAYTSREEIVLHATVLKEDIGKAVSLLLELATCPTFPKEEIEHEKGVVVEEIKSYKDSPPDDVCDTFEENLFKGHPLGGRILGNATNVRKITCSELHRFVEAKFTPCNMALAIVANVEEKQMEERLLKLAEKAFGGNWKASPERILKEITAPPAFNIRRHRGNYEVNAVIGSMAPSLYDEKGRFTTILLSNILGGPSSNSLLYYYLRERNGWVYGVDTYYTQYSDSGILAITFACEKGNIDRCVEGIWKIISKMQENEYPDSKLRAAKRQLLGQMVISSDNGETQCLSMGKSLITYGTVHDDEYDRAMIESITAQDLRKAAIQIFNPERTSSLIFL